MKNYLLLAKLGEMWGMYNNTFRGFANSCGQLNRKFTRMKKHEWTRIRKRE